MSQTVQINITTGAETTNTIKNIFLKPTSDQREEARAISNYLIAAESGLRTCFFDVQVNNGAGVAASGTIIFSDVSTANDTILINGVTLTAVSGTPTNNQWQVKGTAALQATEVARAINASSTSLVSGQVTAAKTSTATVTITSNFVDISGNTVTIAKGVDAGSVMTVSGARLTGGVSATANVYHFGK